MTHTRSHLIWDNISILANFQFPWRFLSLAIFCLSVLVGISVRYFPAKWRPLFGAGLVLIMLMPAVKYFHPVYFLNSSQEYYYDDIERIQTEMSNTWPDFLPKTFQKPDGLHPLLLGEVSDVTVYAYTSKKLVAKATVNQPTAVTLRIAGFPGWATFLNNQQVDFTLDEHGLITVQLPAPGIYEIRAELHRTQLQLISDIISVGSLAALIFIKTLLAKSRS